jgi:hypothetical protein
MWRGAGRILNDWDEIAHGPPIAARLVAQANPTTAQVQPNHRRILPTARRQRPDVLLLEYETVVAKSAGRIIPVGLREQKDGALHTSRYGQAIGYVLNHWDELRRFTEDGHLEIDNNTAERTLRLCAISRKNWLFVGSDQGGGTAAIYFSILAGAKRHGSNRSRM